MSPASVEPSPPASLPTSFSNATCDQQFAKHLGGVSGRVLCRFADRAARNFRQVAAVGAISGIVHRECRERADLTVGKVDGVPRVHPTLGVVSAIVTDDLTGDPGDPGGSDAVGQPLQRGVWLRSET
jgi:hypothetical protein